MKENIVLLSTVISVSILLSACDSATITPESAEVDITPIFDSEGNITNLLELREISAVSCGTFHNIVSAKSSDSYDDDYSPSRAIDNDLGRTSRWSSKGTGNSITLDLGSTKPVTSIETAWYKADLRIAYFDVDTSNNGNSWTNVLSGASAQGTEDFIAFDLQETNARYVRIVGQGNSASSWNSLIEVKVAGCDTSGTLPTPAPTPTPLPTSCNELDNLKIDSASSTFDYDANYKPSNVIDNNLSTESRWSTNGTNRSVTLDLGNTSTIRSIGTAWYKANVRTALFDVETSTNNRNWQPVLSQASVSGTQGMKTLNVEDTEARYVKIIGQGNSASSWTSLIEVDVLGCGTKDDSAPPTPAPTSTPTPDPTSPTADSFELIESLFDLEGGPNDLDPIRGNTLVFDALAAQHVTPNGNGWRHEYKMAQENRRRMHDIDETLQATISADLSDGSKTIVAQYHGGGLGTLVKLYISDTNEKNLSDSEGGNGIFDLYARVKTSSSSSETVVKFGTIRSGQSFDFVLKNKRGTVTVTAKGISETLSVSDSDGAYLKFGNYLQAQDPISMDKYSDSDDWEDLYRRLDITKSVVTYSNVEYTTNN